MSKFNPYEILEVSKDDNVSTIEKKFKKLAVKYHPDKNKSPEAVKIYENLSKAKDILIDQEKRTLFDKYGITNESESREYQEKKQQEMMLKHKLKEVTRLNVSINDILNGFSKELKIKREVINSRLRQQSYEVLEIKIVFDNNDPINKPIIFENKGKKYDSNCGDLIILLEVQPDSTYKINKSNHNLITQQKITLAQSLCGFELTLQHTKDKQIIVQYDSIIKPNSIYILKNMGLNLIDDNDIMSKSDIEVHFEIKYAINQELSDKLKTAFNYKYTKSDKSLKSNIYTLEEGVKEEQNQNRQQQHIDIESMFGGMGGMPGMMGGMPGMMGGMPGMMGGMPGGMPGMRVDGNVQECQTS